jgi:F-box domain
MIFSRAAFLEIYIPGSRAHEQQNRPAPSNSQPPVYQTVMFQLPFDLFVLILECLQPAFVISLRLVNTTWRDAVDGEDVSKWLLDHPRFTFRGKVLRQYREAMNSSDSYQNIMSRLCLRLRRSHHDGPVYRYSIPLAPERKFWYGNNFGNARRRRDQCHQYRDTRGIV